MSFQYSDYRGSPAAGSIAELMLRRGEIAAQQANAVAGAQARATEIGGQAWAGAAQNIGQTVAAIPAQMQQQKTQALQAQALQQNVDQGARAASDMKALDNAYAQPGGRDAIINALPGHLRPTVQKQFTDADEAAAKVQETALKVTEAQNDYFGGLAANIRDHQYDPTATQLAISHAKQTYAGNTDMLKQIGALEQQFQSDPTKIQPIVDQLISVSTKQKTADAAAITAKSRLQSAQTGADRLDLERPKIAAETQTAQQNANGTQPITPYQQAELGNRSAALKVEQGRLGIDQSRLGLEREKVAKADGDKTDLTPEGLDAAAMMFAKTGQLPALGMGDKTTRKAIINRAAALTPGLDLATAKADFGANSASLKNITGTLDTLTSFEKTAGKNLDTFLALADKIPDTGVPWLNTPVRLLNDKMVGNENQAAANAARDVALREIARVTNDPKLSGVLSDSARHEVAGLSPRDATFAQIKAVAKVLKQDMANVHESLTEQQGAIQVRIKLGGGPATATPPIQHPIPGIEGGVAESTDGGKTWKRIQ